MDDEKLTHLQREVSSASTSSTSLTPVNHQTSLSEKEQHSANVEPPPSLSTAVTTSSTTATTAPSQPATPPSQPPTSSSTSPPYTTATSFPPLDPENPLNWPLPTKLYHALCTALLSLAVTYGSSSYSPGIPSIASALNISVPVSTLGLSLYVLGLALGPLISAGLSETYGRRPVYLYLPPLALLFTLGAGLSKSVGPLLVCRFLAGALGAAPLSVGAGTNADLWAPLDRARGASFWILMPFLGPALGPSTAGYPVQELSWRWGSGWLPLIVGGAAWVFCLGQRETYAKVILKRRAREFGLEGPVDRMPVEVWGKVKVVFRLTVLKALGMLVSEPIVLLFSLYSAFTFGVLFAFFTMVTWVYRTVYGFSVGKAGLVFLAIGCGSVVATVVFWVVDQYTYRKPMRVRMGRGEMGMLEPEERLYSAMLGGVLLPISLFWFGFTAREDVHWIVPTLGLGVFGCGNLLVFDSTATYLSDVYGPLGGASAMSANSLARYGFGAAFPLFSVQMTKGLGVKGAGGLLGGVTVLMMGIPFLFWRFGKRVRARGKEGKVVSRG